MLELDRRSQFSVALREFEKIHKCKAKDLELFHLDGSLVVPMQTPADLGWKHCDLGFFQVVADWRVSGPSAEPSAKVFEGVFRSGRKRRRPPQFDPAG